VALPLLDSATAPPWVLEPNQTVDGSLTKHRMRGDELENALAAVYNATVDSFAASQLRLLRADHLSSYRQGGVPATDATEVGAARIDAMQQMMLSWSDQDLHPTASDICSAHAALVPNGGILRTCAVRAGTTKFGTPAEQLQHKLEELMAELKLLSARPDLNAVAKAAWAGYNFVALHPFQDGNGRLARGLTNMMLRRFGTPFVVSFAASDTQRAAYRTALIASHKGRDVKPWATLVAQCVARAWDALEGVWQSKRDAARAAAAGASQREAREAARASACMICLDEGPTCSLLCCGGAYHMRCLAQWLESSGTTCPGCRADVPPEGRPVPVAQPRVMERVVFIPHGGDPTEEDDTSQSFDNTTEDDPTEEAMAGDVTVDDDTTTEEAALIEEGDSTEEDSSAVDEDGTSDDIYAEDDTAQAEEEQEGTETMADDTTVEEGDGTEEEEAQADDTVTEEDDTTVEEETADMTETTMEEDSQRPLGMIHIT